MDPLLVLYKCKPHLKGPVANVLATRTMVVFAEDAIYVVGMSRDLIGTAAGEVLGDLVAGKLSDWRSARVANAQYAKFAEDIERYVAEQKKAYRFEYADLKTFVYRRKIRGSVGIVSDYISLQFEDQSFYFDVGDKKSIDPAMAIIEDLAPHAVVKRKRGAMVSRS